MDKFLDFFVNHGGFLMTDNHILLLLFLLFIGYAWIFRGKNE